MRENTNICNVCHEIPKGVVMGRAKRWFLLMLRSKKMRQIHARIGELVAQNEQQRMEIERLRAALAFAVSELSTHEHWGDFDHHEVVDHFLKEARRDS